MRALVLAGLVPLVGACTPKNVKDTDPAAPPAAASNTPAAAAQKRQGVRRAAQAPAAQTPVQALSSAKGLPPNPHWQTGESDWGARGTARETAPFPSGAGGFTPFSKDPGNLRAEVAMICGSARANKDKEALGRLVADLYQSDVDPGIATEALLYGDCGSLSGIVREMVTQGGDQALAPVVERALLLGGADTQHLIESAASAGLERNLGMAALAPLAAEDESATSPRRSGSLTCAMAYFPSQASEPELETSKTAKTLYSNATPGYGIYTFVLSGGGYGSKSQTDQSRYAELLRVIETYVLTNEKGGHGPKAESHSFLVPVQPDRSIQPLMRQTAPELSASMRKDLARQLRQQGQTALAERLENRSGPFLISTVAPTLTPANPTAPRLIVDLSKVGPEYMYAIVDAYDKPLKVETAGYPESLEPIRNRLLGTFGRNPTEDDMDPAIEDAWIFRLGGPSVLARSPEPTGSTASVGKAASGNDQAPMKPEGDSRTLQVRPSSPATDSSNTPLSPSSKTQADTPNQAAPQKPKQPAEFIAP